MRKIISFILVVALLLTSATGLVGCGPKVEESKIVAFLLPYSNPFFNGIADAAKVKFEAEGYQFESANANGDATVQPGQIENYVTMGVKLLIVMAVSPDGVRTACESAMKNGVQVLAFTTNPGENACDIYMGSAGDEALGAGVAEIGLDWITDKKIENPKIVVLGNSYNTESVARSKGISDFANAKYSSGVTVVTRSTASLEDAQSWAETYFETNKADVVLCYNSAMAQGVNAYAMTKNSAIKDKSKFGVFGCDVDGTVMGLIGQSKADASVFRGVVSLGGIEKIITDLWTYSSLLLKNQPHEKVYVGDTELIKGWK